MHGKGGKKRKEKTTPSAAGEVEGVGSEKGKPQTACLPGVLKIPPFQLVYFLASHLLIKTASWNVPTVRRRCFEARPFVLCGSLVPPAKEESGDG